MENLGYTEALVTPGFASLARRFGFATSYYATSHPSLPNYLALTSGNTWGITSDCTDCYVSAPDLGSQLSAAGIAWGAYMEGIPSSCYLDPYSGGDYAGKHDPFRYYSDIRSSAALCSHIQPFARLQEAIAGGAALPRLVWVTPNLCHDGHDCSPGEAASWLDGFVATVTASRAWVHGGVLFVTWDEGNGGDASTVTPAGSVQSCCGGGQVLTLVIAPGEKPGMTSGTPYNHYSLLATVEDAFGLPLLASAKSATPLAAFFRR